MRPRTATPQDALHLMLADTPLQQSARDHLLLHFSRNGAFGGEDGANELRTQALAAAS